METMEQFATREQPITLTGMNYYIISDFENRIKLIVKELENLKTITNKTGRQEVISKINQLYKGETI